MEVLGFGDTPESQFRDQTFTKSQHPGFTKSQHPGFMELLDGNKFLGVGGRYLCSDQIVRVSFVLFYFSVLKLKGIE